jgi:hypothetical protein
MLVAGAVTFVASLSLALGPQLVPDRAPGPVRQVVHKAAKPTVAEAPARPPAVVEIPVAQPAPEPAPAQEPTDVSEDPAAELPAAEPVPPPPDPPPPDPDPHPLLANLLERLYGQEDPTPDQPTQGLPPNPGAPTR